MQAIDAHQHFWKYNPVKDSWIKPDMQIIRRDFLPDDLWPMLKENHVAGCVAVQADQSETETLFLLELAQQYDFIKAVVGWIDLQAENIEERLVHFSGYKKLRGFRHILQGEADRALMLTPAFKHGISCLSKHGFTYDVLIHPDQLSYACELAGAFPEQKFVVDHMAKPPVKSGELEDWARDIKQLALHSNVWCKVSGLVTEADWGNWNNQTFKPYLDTVFTAFGTDRLMFGSDWPVCLLAGSYTKVKEILTTYMAPFLAEEQEKVWRSNAIRFYNLSQE